MWAGDITTLYEKGTSENAWADSDLSDWSSSYCTPSITDGVFTVSTKNAGWTNTKTISPTSNAIVTLEASVTGAGANGRNGSYDYVQIGGVIFKLYGQDRIASINIEGTETSLATSITRGGTYIIKIIVNTATSEVSYSYNGGDVVDATTASSTAISNVVFGHYKAASEGYSITTKLNSIKVTNETQAVTNVGYTINYKLDEDIVKTVSSTSIVGAEITAETVIDGDDSNHYLITADEAPSMTLVENAEDNVLNVPVRAPYTATLSVTTTVGSTPSVVNTPLTETDDKVCAWSFSYSKYALDGGVYYLCDETEFAQSGTFTDGETIEKTVTYSTADANIQAFTDVATNGTNATYSGGAYTNINSNMASCTVDQGIYKAEIYVVSKAGSGSSHRTESVMVGGEAVATTPNGTNGVLSYYFTVENDDTEVYVKGNGTSNYTDNLDYVLISKVGDIVTAGTYYLKNKATGAYFAAGLNYGTKAMTNTIGHTFTLSKQDDGYAIDTQIFNGNDTHYLNGVWTDGAQTSWNFFSDGEGYYTVNNGSGNLTAGSVGAELSISSGTADNAKWQLLTETAWKTEQVARLDAATSSNGVDATFYIPAANFNRNDNTENAKWQGSPTINGYSANDVASNYNGEKFTNPYATFDVYQDLTGLKPGAYKLTMQGYYRNGLDNASDENDNLAILYANDETVSLVNININAFEDDTHSSQGFTTAKSGYYVPDSQVDAAKAFNNGYYNNELNVVVGEDGALRLGVKKTAESGADQDWAVFDNFQLTYYGTTYPLTIGTAGWATLYTPYALDFSTLSSSFTAYTASLSESTVTLTSVSDVPANTGVVLKGTAGSYNIPVAASSETAQGSLTGNASAATAYDAYDGYNLYMLALNGDEEAQFTKVSEGSIAAGKAFLKVAQSSGVKSFNVVFNDAPTGVSEVKSQVEEGSNAIFNMAGQRVSRATKGMYIVNGKKVLVK